MINKFKSMLAELKTSSKLNNSIITKLTKIFDERIRAAHTKINEGQIIIFE